MQTSEFQPPISLAAGLRTARGYPIGPFRWCPIVGATVRFRMANRPANFGGPNRGEMPRADSRHLDYTDGAPEYGNDQLAISGRDAARCASSVAGGQNILQFHRHDGLHPQKEKVSEQWFVGLDPAVDLLFQRLSPRSVPRA